MTYINNLFKFELHQLVNVTLLGQITDGIVVERTLKQNKNGNITKRYLVQFTDNPTDLLNPCEESLIKLN